MNLVTYIKQVGNVLEEMQDRHVYYRLLIGMIFGIMYQKCQLG